MLLQLNVRKCAACHHVALPLWSMIEAERGYQANSSVISTADQMMQTLIQMAGA